MGERTGEVVVGVIALIIIIGAILFIFYWEPAPAKTITVKPITIPRAEKVGENVGSKTGRFVGGFFKGLWKRD